MTIHTARKNSLVRFTSLGLGLTLALGAVPATALAQSATAQSAAPQSANSQPSGSVLTEAPLTYLVNRGDTLIDVARKYLRNPADYRRLQRDNRVANPRRMATGRTLQIDTALLRTREDPARIESFRGDVQVLRNGAPVAVAPGAQLREGDVVSTGSSAFARIAFSDGTYTVVPSRSSIRMDRLRRFVINDAPDHRLVVNRGRVENRVTSRQRPGGFRVTTPTAISAVRGTEFRVAYDDVTGNSSTGVLEGTVAVADETDTHGVLVPNGQGVALRAGDDTPVPVALLAAPVMAEDDLLQTDATLAFDYSAPSDARIVRGFIAADASMQDLLAEADAPVGQPLTYTDLPEGQYFLRLTAVSPDGLEGRGRTFNFIRARNGIDGLSLSEELANNARLYRFKWRAEGEGDASFRFQLTRANEAGEPEGQPLIDSAGLSDSTFTLSDLPPGTYSWRIEGTRYRFGHRLSVWSSPEVLTINR